MGTMVRNIFIALGTVLLTFMSITPVVSAESALPALVISEVKIRNDSAGFNEFIELYNPSGESTDLSQYYIEYASSPTPTTDMFKRFVIASGLLESAHSLVLAKDNLDPMFIDAIESPFSSLSDDGGTVRILDTSEQVIDSISWTKTQSLAIGNIKYQCTMANTICNANKSQSFTREIVDDQCDFIIDASWSLVEPSPVSSPLLPIPPPVVED
ncbi:MAG: lamin tail domain-containing protein, partial [Candidatus Saccharimonadales bacterium]